nr:uncharacterized protein LOC106733006 isoform X1 [Pelodiscus sinensis]XP_025034791.1 uncharacterized protein LOC106733006 isoform X2 [Pelodiscus sinensis]|eukprot:XP_014436600.1 uncharacterized protein LOC106733006 isoform X1 [Pelodiscus sinensis]
MVTLLIVVFPKGSEPGLLTSAVYPRLPGTPQEFRPHLRFHQSSCRCNCSLSPADRRMFSISHPTTKRFLKGMSNLYPHYTQPADPWDLKMVLNSLTARPFEPLATCTLYDLSMKVIFLLAITSARRVSELTALSASPPYTIFTHQGVILRTQPRFRPKVISRFHINEPIILPRFHPKPHASPEHARLHTLDVRRALAFYIERTRPFRVTDSLLISMTDRSKGRPLSAQRISSTIVQCIRSCYELRKKPLPSTLRAHLTQAVATSTAFLKGVPLIDTCRAATQPSDLTFANHYAIPNLLIPESTVVTAVFSSATAS